MFCQHLATYYNTAKIQPKPILRCINSEKIKNQILYIDFLKIAIINMLMFKFVQHIFYMDIITRVISGATVLTITAINNCSRFISLK